MRDLTGLNCNHTKKRNHLSPSICSVIIQIGKRLYRWRVLGELYGERLTTLDELHHALCAEVCIENMWVQSQSRTLIVYVSSLSMS